MSDIQQCASCRTRVIPTTDGYCPACRCPFAELTTAVQQREPIPKETKPPQQTANETLMHECPNCGACLPNVCDAFCPNCRERLKSELPLARPHDISTTHGGKRTASVITRIVGTFFRLALSIVVSIAVMAASQIFLLTPFLEEKYDLDRVRQEAIESFKTKTKELETRDPLYSRDPTMRKLGDKMVFAETMVRIAEVQGEISMERQYWGLCIFGASLVLCSLFWYALSRQRVVHAVTPEASLDTGHAPVARDLPPSVPSALEFTAENSVEKLTKLKNMHDAGLINSEEYAATKARILNSM